MCRQFSIKHSCYKSIPAWLLLLSIFSMPLMAEVFSAAAKRGEAGFAVCNACHNPELDPPLGPPMWGLQRRYGMASRGDKQQFIQRIVEFVSAPEKRNAIMTNAVEELGLMPELGLPTDQLTDIATYIYEAAFPPPCAHWQIAIKRAEAKGGAALEHAAKDKMMLQRFCSSS